MQKAGSIILVVICAVWLCAAGPAGGGGRDGTARRAGAGAWAELGPEGGTVSGMDRNPKAPSEVYAVTSFGLVYRSGDNGASWKRKTAVSELVAYNFLDLKIDPLTPSTLYVLDASAVYKSVDKGATFSKLPFPSNASSTGRIAVHPTNPRILYVAGLERYGQDQAQFRMAVLKSVDGGQSWSVHKMQASAESGYAMDIAVAAKNPAVLYACGNYHRPLAEWYEAAVFRSTDAGLTWKDVTPDFMRSQIHSWAVVADPTNPSRAYVTYDGHTDSGVARTLDGGATWQKQSYPVQTYYVFALAIDSLNPRTLYGTGEDVTFKSVDGGINWTPVQKGFYGAGTRVLARGKVVHAASNGGVFRSVNAGASFAPGHKGIRASDILSFALVPPGGGGARTAGAGTLYAGVDGYGLFKSTNGGGAWTKLEDFPGSTRPRSVAAPRSDARRVYFSTYNNLYSRVSRSLDGGKTFEQVLPSAGCMNFRLSIAPSDPDRVLVAGHLGPGLSPGVAGLYLSSNGGIDWYDAQLLSEDGTFADQAVYAPSRPNTIYAAVRTAAGSPAVYKSLNGGLTWTKAGAPTSANSVVSNISGLAVHPTKPNTLYAATSFPGIFKSVNGGASWTRLMNAPPGGSCIALNPSDPEDVFVGTDRGIFHSADDGATWTDISDGLTLKSIAWLEVDGQARLLYAAVRGGGIWRRGF